MDVVVIGAGIVGASCAYHLAVRGARVRVLERAPVAASGSTGRSAAGIRVQFSHPQNVAMSLHSIHALETFEATHGVDAGYRKVGYLFLLPPDALPAWSELRAMQASLGARVEALGPEATVARFPWLSTEGIGGATFGPDDGVLDPHGVTAGYLASARRLGADVRFDVEVRGASRRGGAWHVAADSETFRADAVVNAAGPQAAGVAALAGVALPVEPVRRIVYLTRPLPEVPKPTPLVVDLTTGVYLRSEGERMLFGRSNPDEPAGENFAVDWAWLESTLELAMPRFPFLERAELDRNASWAGLYAMTPDHLPILGGVPAVPGWYNACGFSGHGVQHAPATGLAIAEEVLDGASTTFDLADFRIGRFEEPATMRERNVV